MIHRDSVIVALLALVAGLSIAKPGAAQALGGQVQRAGEQVAGVEVRLHRVTRGASGVVATDTTGREGRFSFQLPPPDTSGFTVYFATAEHLGVRYFGPPLHAGELAEGYQIEVFDTVAVGEEGAPVRVARRDVVLIPEAAGGWEVNEVVRIRNPQRNTYVSSQGYPSVALSLPAGVEGFEAGDGEIGADQVRLMGGRVLVLSPLPPGERDLFFRYRLPAAAKSWQDRLRLPTDTFNLFVRQPAPEVGATGLGGGRMFEVEGETFLQYEGVDLASGEVVRATWKKSLAPPIDPIHLAIGIVALVLAIGAWTAHRRSGGPGATRGDDLVDADTTTEERASALV